MAIADRGRGFRQIVAAGMADAGVDALNARLGLRQRWLSNRRPNPVCWSDIACTVPSLGKCMIFNKKQREGIHPTEIVDQIAMPIIHFAQTGTKLTPSFCRGEFRLHRRKG
ncbi:hypothetical protein P3W85_44060 [Cupriavidus basilensis]|uniref:Uncharacterized protein n=1 Tax=Cupriavidus basilensis TaxID=68895 RepID=A0ABT6B4R2_9BURK|nr:hypothetical protein [Cupriavidus basilensis]MDF3839866.1 hypothetical protein [Cupriavidus basilensis]